MKARECYACGTNKSQEPKHGYNAWLHNRGTDLFLCVKCYDYFRGVTGLKHLRDFKRLILACYACGSRTSFDSYHNSSQWYYNYDNDNNALCKRCYKELLQEPRRIAFKDKRPFIDEVLRTSVCTKCGMIGRTHMHHWKYDRNNPSANTTELCSSCHSREHWKLRRIAWLTLEEQMMERVMVINKRYSPLK